MNSGEAIDAGFAGAKYGKQGGVVEENLMVTRPALQFAKFQAWLARHTRSALGGMIVAGAAVLALGAAAVVALAAVTVVTILAVLGALIYLFARVRFRKPAGTQPGGSLRTLEARRTASGWTVDALGRFG